MHKNLDYSVVEVILQHIQREVGERLNNLVWKSELLGPDHSNRVTRLRSLHALWLSPAEYEMTFVASMRNLKWRYQQDRCGACIVSHMTGDLQVLLDLRCALRSRATSKLLAKHGNPRLQIWVHAWIESLVQHVMSKTGQKIDVEALIKQNEIEALGLKRLRTKIHALRKMVYKDVSKPGGKMQGKKEMQQSDVEDSDEMLSGETGADADAELSVIDAYAASRSSLKSSASSHQYAQSQGRYATASSSVSADPTTKGGSGSPYQHPHRLPAQDSFYSIDDVTNNPRAVCSGALQDIAESPRDKIQTADEFYVPPRQVWKKRPKSKMQQLSNPSHDMQPQHPMPTIQCKDSWETMPVESSYTVCQSGAKPPPRAPRPTQKLQQALGASANTKPGQSSSPQHHRERCPADTYVNLLDPTPFKSGLGMAATTGNTCTTGRDFGSGYTNNPVGSYESVYPDEEEDCEPSSSTSHGCSSVRTPPPNHSAEPSKLADSARTAEVAASNTSAISWGGLYTSGMVYREDLGWFYVGGK